MLEGVLNILAWLIAGALSFSLIIVLAPVARAFRLVDVPDERKIHSSEVPLIGGVAVFIGFAATFVFAAIVLGPQNMSMPLATVMAVLAGGGLLLVTGLIDDLIDLAVSWRVFLTATAAGIFTTFAGFNELYLGDLFGFGELHLSGWECTLFVGVCVFGMVNAFNMLDGFDGILGLNLVAAFVSFHLVTGFAPSIEVLMVVGALCGYLISNLGIAQSVPRTFIGDNGSMLLGYLVAVLLLGVASGNLGTDRQIAPVTALYIVGLPLVDMVTVTLRRIANGVSPFRPGRDHFHHIVINTSAPKPVAIALITLLGATYPTLGAMMLVYDVPSPAQFWAIYGLGVLHFGVTTTVLRRQNKSVYGDRQTDSLQAAK